MNQFNTLRFTSPQFKAARNLALLLAGLFWTTVVLAAELQAQSPKPMPTIHDAALKTLLTQSKNQPVILAFWASWCEPCREEMPALQQLAERWHERGLKVITVAVADTPEKSSEFIKRIAPALPLIHDPDQLIAHSWGVYMLPVTIFLNRQHRIVASSRGAIEWETESVEQQLQSLLQRR